MKYNNGHYVIGLQFPYPNNVCKELQTDLNPCLCSSPTNPMHNRRYIYSYILEISNLSFYLDMRI